MLDWKRFLPFGLLLVLLFVNLAISIARFNSYTTFMGDFKAELYSTSITKSASETRITFEIVGNSGFTAKNAYFSEASCVLSANGKSLGVFQFPSDGILGVFDGKRLVATATFNFPNDELSSKLNYTMYLVTHFLTGNHDTRGTMVFEGVVKEMKK
ncbi:hypothetical protein [Athalassotoga saccharophila]|uniref:hypothetical protein n=1 Tax=Athalassotoga saccharophila TaxID=1441386 RepID=UPI00137B87F8|nr:hypothetical protein [Athalassotoga saccharophila]